MRKFWANGALVVFGTAFVLNLASTVAMTAAATAQTDGQIGVSVNDRRVARLMTTIRDGRVLAALNRPVPYQVPSVANITEDRPLTNPLQEVFRLLHGAITYEAPARLITVSGASYEPVKQVFLASQTVDSKTLTSTTFGVNNGRTTPAATKKRRIATGAQTLAGTTYVPLRVFAELIGAYVVWVPSQRLVAIHILPVPPAEVERRTQAIEKLRLQSKSFRDTLDAAAQNLSSAVPLRSGGNDPPSA